MPGAVQGRQWGGGADLVVHSWAWSGPQEELLVWPGLTQGQAPPAPGKHRQLCLMPAQCAPLLRGQVRERPTPPETRGQGVLQQPGSTQCPEDP